ncbi:MAG: HD domain-containing phosphohydrolase [Thermodesulfobacteriota bacterium]
MELRSAVNFPQLIVAICNAMDLAAPAIYHHQMRTAYITKVLADDLTLPDAVKDQLLIAALLHDIGALTPEEKVLIHQFEEVDTLSHCVKGEFILSCIPRLKPASLIVRHHHTTYKNLSDKKLALEENLLKAIQILFISDLTERKLDRNEYILHQNSDVIDDIKSSPHDMLHPAVLETFMDVSRQDCFWLDMMNPNLPQKMLEALPPRNVDLLSEEFMQIANIFGDIIDFRSSFTITHSTGVSECAARLARLMGFSDAEVTLFEIAGKFHDLGKLKIPNYVLDKNGRLTKDEFQIIKQHTYFTHDLLSQIDGLGPITPWAAYHHERLDGSGYPFHLSGDRLDLGARIMAVADIFTALNEDRPYRKAMPRKDIEKFLKSLEAKNLIDATVLNVLMSNFEHISKTVDKSQAKAKKFYITRFASLLGDRSHLNMLVWDNKFSTGVRDIDEQRMAIINIMNALFAYLQGKEQRLTVIELLEDLEELFLDYTELDHMILHEADDEKSFSYRKSNEHAMSTIKQIRASAVADEFDAALKTLKLLKKWWLAHVGKGDMEGLKAAAH